MTISAPASASPRSVVARASRAVPARPSTVLAQPRRRRHVEPHRAVDLHRRAERLRLAVARMVHLHDHLPLEHLRVGEHPIDAQDRCRRHVRLVQALQPFLGRSRTKGRFDERHQHVAVEDPVAVGREPEIALPLGVLDRSAEERPELLGEDRDDQVAVPRLERRVGHDRRVPRAERLRHATVRPEVLCDVGEQRDLTVEQRQIDVGALARALTPKQRASDRERAEHAAGEIGHRQAHTDRPSAGLAGDGHRAAHRLEREVERRPVTIWPVLSVGRDGADDDPLVQRPELRVGQAEPLHDARPEVLPDDVRLPHEIVEHLAAAVARQIERERLLVTVDRQEVRRLAVGQERRPHDPHRVAAVGVLDLDDLGAQVGEQHRAVRAGQHPGKVQHANAFEELHVDSYRGWRAAAR